MFLKNMAAIDKLYVHTYYEYDDLRKWAIAYYPELLFYFFDITMTYQQWEDNCKAHVKKRMDIAKEEYDKLKKLRDFSTRNRDDIINKKYQYYRSKGVEVSMESVIESNNTMEALKKFTSLPHLSGDLKQVVEDWAYTPNLYHFDGMWHVDWIHCEDGDSAIGFSANTPEEAIDKAYNWINSTYCNEI